MKPYCLILIAVIIDAVLGDPRWLPHPVMLIGKLIKALERLLRPRMRDLRVAGALLCVATVAVTAALAHALSMLHEAVAVYLLFAALAPRCLADEAKKVQKALESGPVELARERVGMLVGRETHRLTSAQVIAATVETVAENTTDAVIAPLLYMLVGAPLGVSVMLVWAFKAVSTLDSTIGYKNERYMELGRFSAKLDDALNYVPARVSGVLMCLSAPLLGLSFKRAWRTMLRDHSKHASPNSAWTEAAAAGALGVSLGGGAHYFGKWVEKPHLGDALRELEPNDIKRTSRMMWLAYAMLLAFAALVVAVFC